MNALAPQVCAHCGQPAGAQFCCSGCAAAFETIQGLGLGSYYASRVLDPAARAPRPDPAPRPELARHVTADGAGGHRLELAVDGLQCGACVWLIESVLAREPGVSLGRVNMTTRRLRLGWTGGPARAMALVALVEALGYRLVPFSTAALAAARSEADRRLMRALAVAGFAASNVMMFSIAVWAGGWQDMGAGTRGLLHWVSALVAIPAVAYAGQPFFRSAYAALRQGRTNMDVPISIGVILVTVMSLVETMRGGEHAYFDSAVSLLFFLLIGRVLDQRARGQARAGAEQLMALGGADVAVIQADGSLAHRTPASVAVGERVLVGMGERIGVDGVLETPATMLDASLVTGEATPVAAIAGVSVFAGTVNLGAAVTVRTTASGSGTLLAECARLIEAAEARRGRFVVLADRVARRYAPVVHLCALGTFLWWWGLAGAPVADAVLTACAVLIITCPCALALAVPAVQVLATSALLRAGIMLKSPTALERLADVDMVVFDKSGTRCEPGLSLIDPNAAPEVLVLAAGLAVHSRHPLARTLAAAAGPVAPADGVEEVPGQGLRAAGGRRLGSRDFVGAEAAPSDTPEMWFASPGRAPVRFIFAETLRADAGPAVAALRAMGLEVRLLSGDREGPVRRAAATLGIEGARWGCTPQDKLAALETWRAEGRRVLMVGDGLNDAPSLAAAHVSMSPSTAADISQNAADVVFQGLRLGPVVAVLRMSRRAKAVMRENITLSIGYNFIMVPLAMAGLVTPWVAAASMSGSSLVVMLNALRVRRCKPF